MRTSKNIMGIENDRTKLSATKRRIVAVGLALAILAVAAGGRIVAVGLALAILAVAAGAVHATYAGTSPTPPVGKCTDFACEQ